MKKTSLLLSLLVFWLVTEGANATSVKISPNATTRSATEVEANYTTTHLFVDEIAGDQIPITIFCDPQTTGVESVEVLTNLNRRERAQVDADGDGIEDGIKPPNANNIPAGNDANYYKAYTMALVSGGYQITLSAQKTGAYRLTARYRLNGDAPGAYRYYNSEVGNDGINKRDHALVISPKAARSIQLYEVNPLSIIATGMLSSQRGTFGDLANGVAGGPRFNLQYVKDLGCNMLWFQPIHPNGIAGRQTDPDTGQPFEVGSPYAVKNFFEVAPLLAKNFVPGNTPASNDSPAGRTQAMADFQSFTSSADAVGVSVMLDAPFNHTSYDAEIAALGQTFFGSGGTNATTEFRNTEARFFSRTDNYDMRAFNSGSIAVAPDRYDFGKFADTYDVFYGRYAALVRDSSHTNDYKNEGDWFDYSIGNESSSGDGNGHFDVLTQKVWRYFAEYTLHWLTQTGYPANPTGASLNSTAGIDALRADFGQGLPPQCWEYIINKTRTRKWNFMFMAESLDGGEVTYRSGRHFDILNENIIFPLHGATNTTAYRNIYEARRNAYGQALVLLNSSSHDEDHYKDPFEALIRYAANSSVDGVPLIFPGQELGLSGTVVPPNDSNSGFTAFGYDRYEVNFGKPIPHFKKYNSLMPLWLKTQVGHASYNYGLAQLSPVFSAIGQARSFSVALRSSNRYFLNLKDSTPHGQIFSVAKYETQNASPNMGDVVFAFVNLDRNASPATALNNRFNVSADTDLNGVNDFGIKRGRSYNVKNIAAYLGVDPNRRSVFLIPGNISGDNLLDNGLFVALNAVPTTDNAWSSAPYEAQYLKLYDVTPPPVGGTPSTPKAYVLGTSITFTWAPANDPDGGISGYHVKIGTTPGGNDVFDGIVTGTSKTVTAAYGQTLYATVRAVNNAGVESTSSAGSTGTIALDPNADQDGDGMKNGDEDLAGTNPLDSKASFHVTNITRPTATTISISWTTVPGKNYQVGSTANLGTAFAPITTSIPADGNPGPDSEPMSGGSVTRSNNLITFTYSTTGSPRFYNVAIAP